MNSNGTTERQPFIELKHVNQHYSDHAVYLGAMARVEEGRDRMLEELAAWSGQTIGEVIGFIGKLAYGQASGARARTFDEYLDGTYGFASIQRLHREDNAGESSTH